MLFVILHSFFNLSHSANNSKTHQFLEYPTSLLHKISDKSRENDTMIVDKCRHCHELSVPEYVFEGIEKLLANSFRFNRQNIAWEEGELAIVVDYHFNYLYLLSYEIKNEKAIVQIEKTFSTSTGVGGLTGVKKTGGTPPGVHAIYMKQHPNAALGEIVWCEIGDFIGKMAPETHGTQWWEKAVITTRRIRLTGLEKINQTTRDRLILIHGTPEINHLGRQRSGGCIRVSNPDVVEIFDQVKIGTLVNIVGDTKRILPQHREGIPANNPVPFIWKSQDCKKQTDLHTIKEIRMILNGETDFRESPCDR